MSKLTEPLLQADDGMTAERQNEVSMENTMEAAKEQSGPSFLKWAAIGDAILLIGIAVIIHLTPKATMHPVWVAESAKSDSFEISEDRRKIIEAVRAELATIPQIDLNPHPPVYEAMVPAAMPEPIVIHSKSSAIAVAVAPAERAARGPAAVRKPAARAWNRLARRRPAARPAKNDDLIVAVMITHDAGDDNPEPSKQRGKTLGKSLP